METNNEEVDFYKSHSSDPVNGEDIYFNLPRTYSKWKVKQITNCPKTENLKKINWMLTQVPYINMVPVTDYKDIFYGFMFRIPWKHDPKFLVVRYIDLFIYGLDAFKNYTYEKPIILVEGAKDCEAVQWVYPFCLAYLSSYPSILMKDFIKGVTRKGIIISDNDHTARVVSRKAKKDGFSHHVSPESDLGVYLERGDKESVKSFIEGVLSCYTN